MSGLIKLVVLEIKIFERSKLIQHSKSPTHKSPRSTVQTIWWITISEIISKEILKTQYWVNDYEDMDRLM